MISREETISKNSMTSSSSNSNSSKKSTWKNFFIWIVIALFIRWQIIEPRWIPSGSMLPTLEIKDRILIEKISPRFRTISHKSLKKGSIVVFNPPQQLIDAGYEEKTALIKRIVGIEGDEIEVQEGTLFNNGKKERSLEEPIHYEMSLIKVAPGQLWVLGDNRNNSLDSHIWGPLPVENVIGTAIWRYWPLDRFGPIRFPTPNKIGPEKGTKLRS